MSMFAVAIVVVVILGLLCIAEKEVPIVPFGLFLLTGQANLMENWHVS